MIFFPSRANARSFANGRKVVDMGANAQVGRRWAVKIL